MILKCSHEDEWTIFKIINDSARAYRGIVPDDRYHEPYMTLMELRREIKEITFFAYEEGGRMLGVAGYQPVKDATLVRHIYILPEHQRMGVGGKLLNHIIHIAATPRVLVGTWKAASWAIRFYEKHGFSLQPNKDQLLKKYWRIPERQIELSVVLAFQKLNQPPLGSSGGA